MLTWELIGAVVGAGLASGREIASFFSRYGGWSFAGILLSVGTMVYLSDASLPESWSGRWPEKLWQALLTLLLVATGGAMLSGAGEVAALTLPLQHAYWIGFIASLGLGWYLAHYTSAGLAWVSRGMLCVLALLILLGYTLPPMQATSVDKTEIASMPLRAITYGGFNAALQTPIMALTMLPAKKKTSSARSSGFIMVILLMLGNGVLLRHPALLAEEMPFIRMMEEFGRFGYMLGSISLYMAILSTLTACMRGIGRRWLPMTAMVGVSLLGFSGVVELVYPLLGGGCALMLAAAKFMNSSRKAFISAKDML